MFLLLFLGGYAAQLAVLLLAWSFVIGGGFVALTSTVNALRPPAGPIPGAAGRWMLLGAVGVVGATLGIYGLTLVEAPAAPWSL